MKQSKTRWQQRFSNFEKAWLLLRDALTSKEITDFDLLQQEGIIQRFEYTFELLWKTLKDYLENEKVPLEFISPKSVIRAAANSKLLEIINVEGDTLLEMLESRNALAHTYDSNQFLKTLIKIKKDYLVAFERIYNFLSKKNNQEND